MIEFVSDNLRKDRDIILTALRKNGNVLQFADDELKDDEHIVLTAVRRNRGSIKYASERIRRLVDDITDGDSVKISVVDKLELLAKMHRTKSARMIC